MAEPSMNPNSPEQMMLVQSFEQMAKAVGAEIPVNLSSEIAAVKAGKRMSGELQRMLAEGSMSLMNQLNPEMMPETEMSYEVDGRMERMSPEMMDNMVSSGQISQGEAAMGMPGPGMTDAQRAIMENEAYNKRLAKEMTMPSQDGVKYSPSSGVTMEPNVMTLEEAVDAGLVTPTRPRMRPAAPMQSPRPQARPMR